MLMRRAPSLALAVSREELQGRVASVLAEMRRKGVSVALFTTPENIYYLSGYQTRAMTASQALIIADDGDVVLVIRRIDEGNFLAIKDRSPISRLLMFSDSEASSSIEFIASAARNLLRQGKTAGVEPGGIFVSPFDFDRMRATFGSVALENLGDMIDRMRLRKSTYEISCHRAAGEIITSAIRRGIEAVQLGALDSEIAAEVASTTIRLGSEWVATWPIILTGPLTGRAHSSWRHEAVKPHEPTTLEFSASVQRYHSPLFRTVIISPTKEQERLAEAVSEAHKAGVQAVRPGVKAEDIYHIEREALGRYGVQHLLGAWVGYSVGISFAPNWIQRGGVVLTDGSGAELQSDMALHLVTMLMRAGEFGIAHSSTVIVTRDGNELLTGDGLSGPVLI